MKKKVVIISILVIIILIVVYIFGFKNDPGFNIKIKNNTSGAVSALKITYEGIGQDVEVPKIEAGETYKTKIGIGENVEEAAMLICYQDKKGTIQNNTLIGYFEQGYKGKVEVEINSVDENGVYLMEIQEAIKY